MASRVKTLQQHLCSGTSLSYTTPEATSILSQEQISQFEKDGFIVVKGLVPIEDLEKYKQRFHDIVSGQVPRGMMTVMTDIVLAKEGARSHELQKEGDVTKLQDWQDDEVLFEYCKHPNVIKYVKAFCGENIRSIHTMLINKPPNLGKGTSRHPMHQDLLYFPLRPSERIVASWTAMQHIDRENGCLSVVPGSHKGELRDHDIPNWEENNRGYLGVHDLTDSEVDQRVFLMMEPGDTVFFHPLLIHGSGRNSTNGYRKAISCHYSSATDVHFSSEIPDFNYKLLDDLMRKTVLVDASKKEKLEMYKIGWKAKSRLVCGQDSDQWEF